MRRLFFVLLLSASIQHAFTQLTAGDPGVLFDTSKFDTDYPQMERWSEAGVRGGIPFCDELLISKIITPTNSAGINAAITELANSGGGTVMLSNGIYEINSQVYMKSNVSLIGESRDGVKCMINMTSGTAFLFDNVTRSGICRLSIEGSWGKPYYNWNYGLSENDELPDNSNVSVKFKGTSSDCWLDQVDIINSAEHPLILNAKHCTVRGCNIIGVHKKAGGYQGYFHIANSDNLIVYNYVTYLRHISLQGDDVEYNVVYKNKFDQEVSFHNDDDGNNLIENNMITLPSDMPGYDLPNYYAMMGPWSSQHTISKLPNFLYRNNCLELNNGHYGATPWSRTDAVYFGPHEVKPSDPHANFTVYPGGNPKGNTLYPLILGNGYTETFELMKLTGFGTETYTGDSGFVWNVDAEGVSGFINSSKGINFGAGVTGLVSDSISGGISKFSMQCKDIEDSASYRKLELLINDIVIDSSTNSGIGLYTFAASNIHVKGNFKLAIKNASDISADNVVAIDNITWYSFVEVSGVSIYPAGPLSISLGDSVYLTKNVLPGSASDKSVEWSSSDPLIATVNQKGLLTAVSAGRASIIVKANDGGYTDTSFVTVLDKIGVTDLSLSQNTLSLIAGQSAKLKAVISPEDATDKSVLWSSDNLAIISVSQSGQVTGVSEGNAYAIAESADGGLKDSCLVTVTTLNGEALYTETFENMTLIGWGTETYTGNNGFTWNINGKGTEGYIDSSKCTYMIFDVEGVSSNAIPGGISSFSVQCKDLWEVGTERTINLYINGSLLRSLSHTGTEVYTFAVNDINIPGEITIGLANTTPSPDGLNKSIAVDNISWTSYSEENSILVSDKDFEDSIYPNPFSSSFTLELADDQYNMIRLLDISGKILLSKNVEKQRELFFCPSYDEVPGGLYIIQLISNTDMKYIKLLRK